MLAPSVREELGVKFSLYAMQVQGTLIYSVRGGHGNERKATTMHETVLRAFSVIAHFTDFFLNLITNFMDIVHAPFTEEQVKNLQHYQELGVVHPFTCMSPDIPECQRAANVNEGKLIPTEEGWICPCGKYTQNWAHRFMTEQQPSREDIEFGLKMMSKRREDVD